MNLIDNRNSAPGYIPGTTADDVILGSDGHDNISAWLGDDTIYGGGGNDTMVGGEGVDAFYGGQGTDVLNYQQEAGTLGVIVNLNNLGERAYNSAGVAYGNILAAQTATDTYGNLGEHVEGIEIVHGTVANDTLIGSDAEDLLEAFYTYGGANYIEGGDGHNRYFLRGDLNGTVIKVGTTYDNTRDVINFGFSDSSINTIGHITVIGSGTGGSEFQHHLIFESMHTRVTVNLGGTTGNNLSFSYGATWAGGSLDFNTARHFLEVEGSHLDDVLIGGQFDDLEWYTGNAHADIIYGGDGNHDTVVYENENTNPLSSIYTNVFEYYVDGISVDLVDGSGDFIGVIVNLHDGGVMSGYNASHLQTQYGFDVDYNGYARDRFGTIDTLVNIDDVRATSGDDTLTGSAGNNNFWGLAGDDVITGGGGTDGVIYRDDIFNEAGNPAQTTFGVNVNLDTGLVSNDGFGDTDTLSGIENIYGTDLADTIAGSANHNRFEGNGGNDSLLGHWGNDTLVGGDGNDNLDGQADNDDLHGEAGNDSLYGGAGSDTLTGGTGQDTFVFQVGYDQDQINDFENNIDRIDLRDFGLSGTTEAFSYATESGGHIEFDFGNGDILTVLNMSESYLTNDLLIT
jgi:Ca2+-binding RTX toxin-like protein